MSDAPSRPVAVVARPKAAGDALGGSAVVAKSKVRAMAGSRASARILRTISGGRVDRAARIRDFARAHQLAAAGRVVEARAILARYDVGAVVIEIVPGESGDGEIK